MKERNGLPESKKSEHITRELINAIESIGYGEVVVTIHNFEVVQIEKREKKRFK